MVCDGAARSDPGVRYRSLWGVSKKQQLLDSVQAPSDLHSLYETVVPRSDNWFSYRPSQSTSTYRSWPSVVHLADSDWLLGLNENRGGALVSLVQEELTERMTAYFDENTSLDSLPETLAGLSTAWARFAPAKARAALIRDGFNPDKLVRFTARPFDIRWAYVETAAKLWNESRPSLVRHALAGARFIMTRRRAPRAEDGTAFYASRSCRSACTLHRRVSVAARAPASQPQMGLLDGVLQSEANLSGEARSYLRYWHPIRSKCRV